MDSFKLALMLEYIQNDGRNIHSIQIARHGSLILSAYFAPFNRDTPHNIYSCTKSVTSALTGIAHDKKMIKNLDTPVFSLFPTITIDSPENEAITIRHLLSMTSGIEWTEPLRSGLSDTWSFIEADSPPQYFFDRALVNEPGRIFNYNTGGSHLLSMIIQNTSGMKTSDFARDNLFNPLGITDYTWDSDIHGYTTGGTGLALLPEDMLKFGQLYLQNGVWEDSRILPSGWVAESSSSVVNVSSGINYGYQWWVRPNGIYNALGWGSQEIIVIPQQDMVVVFTAGIRDAGWNIYDDLLNTYILPSIQASTEIPPNASGNKRLLDEISHIANPEPSKPAPLPETVRRINNKTYVDLNGSHGWSTYKFHFEKLEEAQIELMYGNKSEQIIARIGLDGLFRITNTDNYGPLALKGYWQDIDTFVLTQQFLKEAEQITMVMTFDDTGVKRLSEWKVEPYQEESESVFLNN